MAVTVTPSQVSLPVLPAGTLFDSRFELGSILGRGGMGTVYRARDVSLDEPVAIKLMRPEFAEDPRMVDRFMSEIKLARRVRHPNVCVIHDYGRVDGTLYISMELIDGADVKRHVQQHGGLTAEQAYDIAIQVADGLHAVHAAGIVHRDLKPSNVVIGGDGVAHLLDFGIAKRHGAGQDLTAVGDVVGTPEYMSPEQAQGRPLDARSDVYALGVLVYELFTGYLPFRGDTPISTILKHIQEPPPLDGPPAAKIPRPLRPVLARALAKDPAHRYANAGGMAAALRAARDAKDAPRRSRGPLLAGVGAAVLVLIVAVSVMLMRSPAVDPAPTTTLAQAAPAPAVSVPAPATVAAAPVTAATPVTVAPPAVVEARVAPPATVAVQTARPSPRVTAAAVAPATVAAPVTSGSGPASTAAARPGQLRVVVRPWAEVAIDGRVVGETPLGTLSLAPGEHQVRLRHPGWEPVERRVTIVSGETAQLVVDLAAEGRRR